MGEGMNKFLNFFGLGEDIDDYEDEDVVEEETIEKEDKFKDEPISYKDDFFSKRKQKVVNLPNAAQVKVVILQPNSYEQSKEICEHLKEKKSVIVNLEFVNKDVARRIFDFASGTVYGVDGSIEKVSNAIFLLTPSNYEVINEIDRSEELKNKLGVSWMK